MGDKTAIPDYEVEFIPVERRLRARRDPTKSDLPAPITGERRHAAGRREEDATPEEHASLLTRP